MRLVHHYVYNTWLDMYHMVCVMSAVIHVRVSRELKERLERLGVNISEEVRRLLEARVHQLELERLAEELERELSSTKQVRDSVGMIREDREKGRL